MAGVNRVTLLGNLGTDPELRRLDNDQVVCRMTVATNETWKDRSGDRQERVEWHNIVVWGALAESCAEYLEKGRQVYIEGRIQTREYEDDNGDKKYFTEIVATSVQFLGGGNRDDDRDRGRAHDDRGSQDDRGSGRSRDRSSGNRTRSSGGRSRSDREDRGSRGGGGQREPWQARGGR